MNKILKGVLITLGVIFLAFIIAIVLFIIFDPLNLRPLLSSYMAKPETGSSTTATGDKNPLLNDTQEKFLESVGVDVSSLPTEITPEMEACFAQTLGADRVQEIKNGSAPNPIDFFKAKDCL